MTLQEFFDICSAHPEIVGFYFVALPLTAFLASVFGKGEGHLTPWKYLYTFIIYLAMIPGIFAIILNVYLFLFERQPIMQTNIYTQILPIFIMIFTLWLVRRNVPFEYIPGFDKISGLAFMTFAILGVMWLLDRMHIFAITFMPFHYVIILLIALFVFARIGLKRMMN